MMFGSKEKDKDKLPDQPVAESIQIKADIEDSPALPSGEVEDSSSLSIDTNVVEKIVAIACRSVDGILSMKGNLFSSIQEGFGGTDSTKGVSVEMVGDDICNISISMIMEYGKSAPKIFNELRSKITEKISTMTGLKVGAVNVRIVNVMTREEMEGGRVARKADPKVADDAAKEDPEA